MRKIYLPVLIVILTVIQACKPSAQDDGLGHHHHDHGGGKQSDEIMLSVADAQRFGIYSQMVKPRNFNEIIKVSGQIVSSPIDQSIVSAPSSGIISFRNNVVQGTKVGKGSLIASISAQNISGGDANESARIKYEALKQEYERVEPLYREGIVSAKEYNAIKQAYDVAKAANTSNSSGSIAKAVSSGIITQLLVKNGEYVSAGQTIAIVSGNTSLTLRADLPEKYYNFLPMIATANFSTSYSNDVVSIAELNGKKISSSSLATTQQPGYIPIYFSFDNNGTIVPGSYVEVYLIGATRQNAIVLPIEAIIEQQGKYYVYVKLDDECYEKRMVSIGHTNGNEIEILSGLSRRDEVVSRGAIIVRLAETSGAVPEGHSHNH